MAAHGAPSPWQGKRRDFAPLFASWGFATAEQRAAAAAAGAAAELQLPFGGLDVRSIA